MISHHPSPEVLADCARGALNAGATLVVAAHIDLCAGCREEVGLWEHVGGVVLQDEIPASLSESALQNALNRLDRQTHVAEKFPPRRLPGYLDRFVVPQSLRSQDVGRRLWVTPNIWFAPVAARTPDSGRTYLMYARPNTKLSLHTHAGREFTTVLHGAFRDGLGLFGPGDFAETDDDILHAPTVTGDMDCLCLISAEAPMRLTNPIARAIQVLTGTFY
ncbi:MAG TPA: ChrR family anti-sigma-E factor [Rhizomicrobium sp.]